MLDQCRDPQRLPILTAPSAGWTSVRTVDRCGLGPSHGFVGKSVMSVTDRHFGDGPAVAALGLEPSSESQ
jgi:hypothetical protein